MSRELRQHAAGIVDAFQETLEAIGVDQLNEAQREALKAFLVMLYERTRERQRGKQRITPPLVG
jgi:hypothetical protein